MKGVVDVDTHILEPTVMWEFIDEKLRARRPVLVQVPNDTVYKSRNAFWLIDGNIFPKPAGKGSFSIGTPMAQERMRMLRDLRMECRELTDPGARLADMDELGVEVQVVYPSLFLIYLTDDAELEIALCRAYNRFVAQACARGRGRLRWVVIPPLRSLDESLREMAWAKEHGAVGVFFRGIEGERSLADSYFFPVYEEAQRLDLPICIHTGAGCPKITSVFDMSLSSVFPDFNVLPLFAFRDLVANRVPERFPRLRFGFIEATSSWVPYLLYHMKRSSSEPPEWWGPKLFGAYRLYVACEADEDIPYLLNYVGEDHIIIGSDYGHFPRAETQHAQTTRSLTNTPKHVIEKILCDNARRFYGL